MIRSKYVGFLKDLNGSSFRAVRIVLGLVRQYAYAQLVGYFMFSRGDQPRNQAALGRLTECVLHFILIRDQVRTDLFVIYP